MSEVIDLDEELTGNRFVIGANILELLTGLLQGLYSLCRSSIKEGERFDDIQMIILRAQEKKEEFPNHASRYQDLIDTLNSPEVVVPDCLDVTNLGTVFRFIEPFGDCPNKRTLSLLKKLVKDRNDVDHPSMQKTIDEIGEWSKDALGQATHFVQAVSEDETLDLELRREYKARQTERINLVADANRYEYDPDYRRHKDFEKEIESNADDVARVWSEGNTDQALDSLRSSEIKWRDRVYRDCDKFYYLRYFYIALSDRGVTHVSESLGDCYYEELPPCSSRDYSKAAYYYERCGIENLSYDSLIRFAGIHLFGLFDGASVERGAALLECAEEKRCALRLARDFFKGERIPREYSKALKYYKQFLPENERRREARKQGQYPSNQDVMDTCDWLNLASMYINGFSDAKEEREGRGIIDEIKANGVSVEEYSPEEGLVFYRVSNR